MDNFYIVHVCVTVRVSKSERRTLEKIVKLSMVPRVGDLIYSDKWGFSFEGGGAEVASVGIDVDNGDIYIWINDDDDSWRDMSEWGDEDTMICKCYFGFTDRQEWRGRTVNYD